MRIMGILSLIILLYIAACSDGNSINHSEGTWDINGTNLHFVIKGTGEPIVVLHGGPGGNLTSKLDFVSLSSDYQWVFFDQRGSGESDRFPVDIDSLEEAASFFSISNYVQDLEEIRINLGIEKMILLGHSWGGAYATFYAAAYPKHVKKLIVYNGGPVWPELRAAKKAAIRSRTDSQVNEFIKELSSRVGDNIDIWDQSSLDSVFIEMMSLLIPAYYCQMDSSPHVDEMGRSGFWANQLTNRYINTFNRESFAEQLSKVMAPTLITYGCCEVNPPERQTFLRDAIPNSKMVIFAESGHNAHKEQPELFRDVLSAFLSDEDLPLQEYMGLSGDLSWSKEGTSKCLE